LRQYKKEIHLSKTEILVVCCISFSLALNSGSFLQNYEGKGFCAGLLTKRFTTTSNLTCKKKRILLGIFTSDHSHSTFVAQCSEPVACKISFRIKYILRTMVPRRKLCNEDNESEQIYHTNSDEYAEDTESAKDEDDYNAPPMQQQQQVMKWGTVVSS
jgi:hypothetical protein